jgi:hypothetical protein
MVQGQAMLAVPIAKMGGVTGTDNSQDLTHKWFFLVSLLDLNADILRFRKEVVFPVATNHMNQIGAIERMRFLDGLLDQRRWSVAIGEGRMKQMHILELLKLFLVVFMAR